MADSWALEMYRGDSYPIRLTLTDKTTKLPIDLTDCSLLFTVNTVAAPVDITTQVFQVAGAIGAPASTGLATFTPTALNTALDPGKYYYDIQLTDAAGNIRTVVKSTFTIRMDITK